MRFRALLPLLTLALAASAADTRPVQGVDRAYMDAAASPCADFYRYANGTYDKEPIPAAYSAFGVNQEIDQRNEAILKALLEAAAADAKAPAGSPARRIGDFFASGMDEAAIEKAGLKPLQPTLARIDALKSAAGLPALLSYLHSHGVPGGFAFYVGIDDKDSSSIVAQLGQDGLGLPEREYYFRDDEATKAIRAAYVKHLARTFELGGDAPKDAVTRAERVMALETSLAKASKTLTDLRDPEANYHKLTRQELVAAAPGFGWEAYFHGVGLPDAQKRLLVGQPEFMKAFGGLVHSVSLADWKSYLRWKVLGTASPYLPKAFEEAAFDFYSRTLRGAKEMHPRWRRVLGASDRALGFDLGKLYVQKAFSPEAKQKVLDMVRFHKDALRASILRAPWMGEATKQQALKKLDSMAVKVGYPDVWRDYTGIAVAKQPFVLNVMAGSAFEFKRRMAKLGKPVDKTEWNMTPQTNNAYYEPTLNEICLPAGILQPPFFDEKADLASNYGALASTIGHEILHGFDDQGSQYDAQGNLKNWWTPEDKKAYELRTDVVVKQYDAYEPLPGLHIVGKQTLGENLADIGGLKISFEAWKLATGGKAQPTIDGLTPEQRFFVAFAQGWRTNEREQAIRFQVTSDVHSPIRERVTGPTSALPEFYQAFGCGDADAAVKAVKERPAIW